MAMGTTSTSTSTDGLMLCWYRILSKTPLKQLIFLILHWLLFVKLFAHRRVSFSQNTHFNKDYVRTHNGVSELCTIEMFQTERLNCLPPSPASLSPSLSLIPSSISLARARLLVSFIIARMPYKAHQRCSRRHRRHRHRRQSSIVFTMNHIKADANFAQSN